MAVRILENHMSVKAMAEQNIFGLKLEVATRLRASKMASKSEDPDKQKNPAKYNAGDPKGDAYLSW